MNDEFTTVFIQFAKRPEVVLTEEQLNRVRNLNQYNWPKKDEFIREFIAKMIANEPSGKDLGIRRTARL